MDKGLADLYPHSLYNDHFLIAPPKRVFHYDQHPTSSLPFGFLDLRECFGNAVTNIGRVKHILGRGSTDMANGVKELSYQ